MKSSVRVSIAFPLVAAMLGVLSLSESPAQAQIPPEGGGTESDVISETAARALAELCNNVTGASSKYASPVVSAMVRTLVDTDGRMNFQFKAAWCSSGYTTIEDKVAHELTIGYTRLIGVNGEGDSVDEVIQYLPPRQVGDVLCPAEVRRRLGTRACSDRLTDHLRRTAGPWADAFDDRIRIMSRWNCDAVNGALLHFIASEGGAKPIKARPAACALPR